MLLPGAMNGEAFVAWVKQALVPTLSTGDIVICDNLNVHKNARARAIIEDQGAELRFLPAYSPDLNPIEMAFAKIKELVRSAAARCFHTLSDAIAAPHLARSRHKSAETTSVTPGYGPTLIAGDL